MKKRKLPPPEQGIVIADTHCGSQLGLCPPKGVRLDEGGKYMPNVVQRKMWRYWQAFWEWVADVTRGDPYWIVLNGDLIDNVHHGATDHVSSNVMDQHHIALEVLEPVVNAPKVSALFVTRGTEAHSGPAAEREEALAERLGARPNQYGQYAMPELWLKIGVGLGCFMHHIGTTSARGYEATAPTKEMSGGFEEAGQWGLRPADINVRSHRHRYIEVRKPSKLGYTIIVTTPGWQGKTQFARRGGLRLSVPQLGGVFIRQGDEDLYTRAWVKSIGRPKVEKVSVENANVKAKAPTDNHG